MDVLIIELVKTILLVVFVALFVYVRKNGHLPTFKNGGKNQFGGNQSDPNVFDHEPSGEAGWNNTAEGPKWRKNASNPFGRNGGAGFNGNGGAGFNGSGGAGNDGAFNEAGNGKRNRGRNNLAKLPGRILLIVIIAVIAAVSVTDSHYVLTEEEYGVVYTFGSPSVTGKAGWNWKLPVVQTVRTVPKKVLGMPIGYDDASGATIDSESLMITKDFNFLDVDFWVDYRVSDPIKALNNEWYAKDIIKNLAQSYIRDTIGTRDVDSVLTTGKTEIENDIETKLRARLEEEDIGFTIENVLMQDVDQPTPAVKAAFSEVENAKQSMDTKINEGNQYKNTKIPEAEVKADKLIKDAEATKQARINEANGEVAKFNAMYEEYSKYPLITKKRMLYETMEDLLPNLKVYITDGNTQTMLPLEQFSTIEMSPAGGQ